MATSRSEKVTQFAIVVIAVCAVVVSVWQVSIAQRHNRLSVRPYLNFFSGWATEDTWALKLQNEGIGPAIIKSVSLTYKGETYTHWDAVLDAAEIRDKRVNSINLGIDAPFKADKEIIYLQLKGDPKNRVLYGIEVLIKYTSIYDEPFEIGMRF
ncbi:hypothetical protein [Roseivirga misakiensis]|uniref:Uncharacterized protein n=1 Tax=Roseivirga misakiensis TaxID=1563681 RepID=A0A1E5SYJ1_9BACT|nr:hypothetical protein [Roseivirga misakiensis]OEK04190.1 hypothetical protein BFP71_11950 [Roseivirga misakiensis]